MLHITPIPAFDDNYIWALGMDERVWLVDPGDGKAAQHWLDAHNKTLAGLLITHHHADHTGGIGHLSHLWQDLPVYGPEGIAGITHPLTEGDQLMLAELTLNVYAVPAHTLDHLAYYLAPNHEHPGALFCGDTLFAAGCGRLFEGTPGQLHAAMQRFAALPPSTLVCCAHEYTLSNLAFALAVEPDNSALNERLLRANCQRQAGQATLPCTIADELATNPFMRAHLPGVQQQVYRATGEKPESELQTLAALRRWKDNFCG